MLVVYACQSKTSLSTYLIAEEPLTPSLSHSASSSSSSSSLAGLAAPNPFRRYASLSIPGHATDISFYRHTLAVVTDKQIVIAEPGNPAYAIMPSPLDEQEHGAQISRLCAQAKSKALGMFQVGEWEFVIVWDWGACFVNRSEYTPPALSIMSCVYVCKRRADD